MLEPGIWTSLINEHVYEKAKLVRKLVYKRAKVYKEGINYLVIDGSCSLFSSKLTGYMKNKPDQNLRAIIYFTYTGDFKTCVGGVKRKFTGIEKSTALQ